jgi:hypothetical protein
MTSTKSFKQTVLKRAERDPEFHRALLHEAMNEFVSGDLKSAKGLLRNYINHSITFGKLAKTLHKNDKSLQRMLGPEGNPTKLIRGIK